MIRFECDYLEGAHPRIMKALADTNFEQTPGYGVDPHCERARELIRQACKAPDAYVQFLVGGTQSNTVIIKSMLRPHEGIISASSGHINTHETGAIEATGHKVLGIDSPDGKITAEQIENYYLRHINDETHEHIVKPGAVYLSQPTEYGTIYKKAELCEISRVCREHSLYLFVDGARMGYGLESEGNDVYLPDLAELTDVFYIGGTKVGALFGEAIVITNKKISEDFRYLIKQHGGMLAKGRLLGIQFETLFEDGLYFEISRHAMKLALKFKHAMKELGVPSLFDSPTNQQFPIFARGVYDKLSEKYSLNLWEALPDGRIATRVCTSWATDESNLDALINDIKQLV